MDSKKLKLARAIGVICVIVGVVYWVASFFLPSTYGNDRPRSDAVFSTEVVSREDAERGSIKRSESEARPSEDMPIAPPERGEGSTLNKVPVEIPSALRTAD